MVVSIDIEHTFEHPIEFVATTHFSKYPNDKEKFVQRIDTIEHEVGNSHDYRKRVAVCHNVVPRVLRMLNILNIKHFLLQEESWLNYKSRVLRLKSHNVTWSNYAHIWEESTFTPSPENPQWTKLVQHGEVNINGIGWLGTLLEPFAERFLHAGASRGLKIMDDIMAERTNQEKKNTISSVKCWTEKK